MGVAAQGFSSGARAALRGLSLAWQSPEVRRTYVQLVIALLGISVVLDVFGIWAVLHWTSGGAESWWAAVGLILLRVAGIAVVLLVAPVLALFTVNFAFSFLSERVFLAGLRLAAPQRAEALAQAEGLPTSASMADSFVRTLLFFSLSLGTFALAFVPVVGAVLAPVLQAYWTARALGWELLDTWFDKQRMRFDDQHAFVRRNRTAVVGFGLPFAMIMAIPVLGPLAFGLAQAAAGVLVAEVLEASTLQTTMSGIGPCVKPERPNC